MSIPAQPSRRARRIGIFGGSFDPVQNAHVALARQALGELALDELRWVPAGQPWQKAGRVLAPAQDRMAMLAALLQGEPGTVIDPRELQRAGPTYTIDTVRELQTGEPSARWFLLIGQDQYAGFHSWHGWRELLSRVTLAIAGRPGASLAADRQVLAVPHVAVTLPMMDVSSTHIRARLRAGQQIDGLVPAAVARYIEQHHLYLDQQENPVGS